MHYIWLTDIDRTLIHSSYFLKNYQRDTICVEYIDNKEMSYMDIKAYELFNSLLGKDNLSIIPITARSIEQYSRIGIMRNNRITAITSNGGQLVRNKVKNIEWSGETAKRVNIEELSTMASELNKVYGKYLTREFKLVDNTYIYAVISPNCHKEAVREFNTCSLIDTLNYYVTIQVNKVYICPVFITKKNAAEKLIERYRKVYEDVQILTSGDGYLDKDFVELSDCRFVPDKSELSKVIEHAEFVPDGMLGTCYMLREINDIVG